MARAVVDVMCDFGSSLVNLEEMVLRLRRIDSQYNVLANNESILVETH